MNEKTPFSMNISRFALQIIDFSWVKQKVIKLLKYATNHKLWAVMNISMLICTHTGLRKLTVVLSVSSVCVCVWILERTAAWCSDSAQLSKVLLLQWGCQVWILCYFKLIETEICLSNGSSTELLLNLVGGCISFFNSLWTELAVSTLYARLG